MVVVGLPGSGKTEYLRHLAKKQKINSYLDDYEYGPLKRSNPQMRDTDKKLIDGLKRGEKWAIADTRFCEENERIKLISALSQEIPKLDIKFEYFTNEPDLCQKNAEIRKSSFPRHEINLIVYYSELYRIPKNAKTLPVYKRS